MNVEIGISLALGQDHPGPLDPRLLPCMQIIEDAGSLSAAARRLGLSYRHLWGLLGRWERQCGSALVHLQRGRGARLSPLGRTLLDVHRQIQEQLAPDLERLGAESARLLENSLAGERAPLVRLSASDDLSLGVVRELFTRETGCAVELRTRGSLESLRLLTGGGCDLAGFHLYAPLFERTSARELRDLLDPGRHRLLRLVARRQGLITAAANPFGLTTLADIAGGRCRFVNRQPGSGTRLLVDALLERDRVGAETIAGYEHEEFTHLAVAAMVASGAADAGFGIEAAARNFTLDFIPVVTEQYWLAVDTRSVAPGIVQALTKVLQGAGYRERIAALAGYNAARAGEQCSIETVFEAVP